MDLKELAAKLGAFKDRISKALPPTARQEGAAEALIETALTAIRSNTSLLDAPLDSIFDTVIRAAQLGLNFDTALGHAYIVPQKGKATLQIGYKGYIALAERTGEIASFSAELVYEADEFSVSFSPRKLHHVPNFDVADRGKIKGAYCLIEFNTGKLKFEYMPMKDLLKVKASSKGGAYGPWKTHEEEMYRKCPIRKAAKTLPMRSEDAALIKAAGIDEYNDQGFDTPTDRGAAQNSDTSSLRERLAAMKQVTADGEGTEF